LIGFRAPLLFARCDRPDRRPRSWQSDQAIRVDGGSYAERMRSQGRGADPLRALDRLVAEAFAGAELVARAFPVER